MSIDNMEDFVDCFESGAATMQKHIDQLEKEIVYRKEDWEAINDDLDCVEKERDELKAHCEWSKDLLREAITLFKDTISGDYKPDSYTVQPYVAWLNETPTQSLAEIKAQAIEEYGIELEVNGEDALLPAEYAQKIREGK